MKKIRAPGRNITIGDAVLRLNPHLIERIAPPIKVPKKYLIRQRHSPSMNNTEARALAWLQKRYPDFSIQDHNVTFTLANGVRYTPDLVGILPIGGIRCWEVKGPKVWDDAIVKVKVIARQWPQINFSLLYEGDNGWVEERVMA